MKRTNPKVDAYLRTAKKWQAELKELRKIVLECPLTEELKWRNPCYTFHEKNVAMIGAFKDYCALSFFKGALLKDAKGILVKPGENTQAARLVRFTSVQEIVDLAPVLSGYIREAIDVEEAGLKVTFAEASQLDIPVELQAKLDENPALKTAFAALTPGRQKGYILYFTAAKQSATRVSRINKYTDQILDGKGINDCTCGHSRKMPQCDGSHKHFQ
ncbi:MAG: YdeI/OmpD-associated family protein [Phycisphaerales bacterium]|nr:YdeI/OmpD-associated family protein [Phycisphaerales bacterium]